MSIGDQEKRKNTVSLRVICTKEMWVRLQIDKCQASVIATPAQFAR
jgi:hypothetical protein